MTAFCLLQALEVVAILGLYCEGRRWRSRYYDVAGR